VNWWVVTGRGETQGEALQELEKAFENAKLQKVRAGKAVPGPGTHVPI
jgi:hypothetical protein